MGDNFLYGIVLTFSFLLLFYWTNRQQEENTVGLLRIRKGKDGSTETVRQLLAKDVYHRLSNAGFLMAFCATAALAAARIFAGWEASLISIVVIGALVIFAAVARAFSIIRVTPE